LKNKLLVNFSESLSSTSGFLDENNNKTRIFTFHMRPRPSKKTKSIQIFPQNGSTESWYFADLGEKALQCIFAFERGKGESSP
jgi:hypothetical protein